MRLYVTKEVHELGGPGLFLLGRAEEQLARLLEEYRGKVQLIYLDPPFGTGDTFSMKGADGGKKIPLFADDLKEDAYLKWMRTILTGCRELLCPAGSLYLHIDYRMSAKLRLLLDELFGESNFMNEIIWSYRTGGRATRFYPRKHDNILFYRKSRKVFFSIEAVGKPRGPEKRNHMKQFVDENGRVGFSIRTRGKLYTYYEDDPVYPADVWTDIEHLQQKDKERLGYATQKPEALLERIISASSREGDLVCDLFAGSGTTAAVAARLKRQFVTVDASPVSLLTVRKRLVKQGGSLSLLEDAAASAPLTLCYPADRCKCVLRCTTEHKSCKSFVTLQEVSLNRQKNSLSYAATGVVEDGVFRVFHGALQPKLPLRMPLPPTGTPVLQVANLYGSQAFVTVEG